MRKIGVIIGSKSDLPQCEKGLKYLARTSAMAVSFVNITSIHRNTLDLLIDLGQMSLRKKIDVLITGAGWANHLSGTSDAFLRNQMKDTTIVVYGVAFEDAKDPTHTEAAILSITQVPGTKVVFRDYVGSEGFYRACCDAVNDELAPIELPKPREPLEFTLEEALVRCQELTGNKNEEGGVS